MNKYRQLHPELMKIATVSGLKNNGGCNSFERSEKESGRKLIRKAERATVTDSKVSY